MFTLQIAPILPHSDGCVKRYFNFSQINLKH